MSPGKKHGAKEAEGPSCCTFSRVTYMCVYMYSGVGLEVPSRRWFFLTYFLYVKIKSKSTFVLKHDPSESNETTFEVARFLVFMLWHFFWKSLRESKSDFRENREK